ncbi:hypothetical protein GCM10027073_44400 [Streptomyces chlorus]
MEAAAPSYKGFRYPAEIISHVVWLYHRLPLSFREVEELLLARGTIVSHETIRQWCTRFGPQYAAGLRRGRPQAGDKWHLDEVYLKINGAWRYLWRAVDTRRVTRWPPHDQGLCGDRCYTTRQDTIWTRTDSCSPC